MPGILAPIVLLAACAQPPMGPTVPVMPGPGKSFDAFRYDQSVCEQYAQQMVAGQVQNANMQGGLGAAIGGGRGAAIGAASGAGIGTGIGASSSANAQYSIQQQYDNAYAQCMYSKGEAVPGYGPQ